MYDLNIKVLLICYNTSVFLNQKKFKAICLDYGGVIATKPNVNFDVSMAKLLNIDVHIFKKVYFRYSNELNSNKISRQLFWSLVLKDLNKSKKIKSVIDYIDQLPEPIVNNHLISLCDEYRKHGIKVGILTNRTKLGAIELRKSVGDHFDVILVSSELGFSKPQPEAFHCFADDLGISLSELVFIDDSDFIVEAAKRLGCYAFQFTNYLDTYSQLRKLFPAIKI